jgi:homoserine dehydrogenase|tara:strand:+ start:518 stop:1798 length:1281 start_codon:yes stop_codon:yes gene_type:complete
MVTSAEQSGCTVGIAGFGTVGQAVARILSSGIHPGLRLTHVCNRNVARKQADWVAPEVVWTESFDELVNSQVDVIVELVGGLSPAQEWIELALSAGKSVVTANKQVIAHAGPQLMVHARRQKRHLLFEAAVAGGIPIVRALREGVCGDQLCRIQGILNGTCNYILTRMEQGQVSFSEVLADAQRLGYAEADPTADVDGFDAQSKLAILIGVGLGRAVRADDIPLCSITPIDAIDFVYAKRLGCVIRQVARAELIPETGGIRAAVQPALVPEASSIGRVGGSQNIVVVDGKFGGETALSGLGAGGEPTAVAVVSDLLAIARGTPVTLDASDHESAETEPVTHEFKAPHYVRFMVADRRGIIAALAEVFSRHGVNFDALLQEPGCSKAELPFVITLEACSSSAVAAALGEIERFDFHVRPPLWLPMLL